LFLSITWLKLAIFCYLARGRFFLGCTLAFAGLTEPRPTGAAEFNAPPAKDCAFLNTAVAGFAAISGITYGTSTPKQMYQAQLPMRQVLQG